VCQCQVAGEVTGKLEGEVTGELEDTVEGVGEEAGEFTVFQGNFAKQLA